MTEKIQQLYAFSIHPIKFIVFKNYNLLEVTGGLYQADVRILLPGSKESYVKNYDSGENPNNGGLWLEIAILVHENGANKQYQIY